MQLNPHQERVANHVFGRILTLAGPGSGKTKTLTERTAVLSRYAQGGEGDPTRLQYRASISVGMDLGPAGTTSRGVWRLASPDVRGGPPGCWTAR